MATYTIETYDQAGTLIASRTVEAPQDVAARDDLQGKARQALTANAAYLAIATPTNAQNLAQIRALTRENNALIRLMLGLLDDTTGT